MSDEAEFLRRIRENPADRLVRLVYADWLDERGDPRGEYLRLCCRLAEVRDEIDPDWRHSVRESDRRMDDIRLASGRSISLLELRQQRVYSGLLEGLPTREMNAEIIDRLVEDARRARPYNRMLPHVLTPEQRPVPYYRQRPYPFGEPAALPPVGCIGHFDSLSAARDLGMSGSMLTVIWFQEEFAPPIGPEVWPRFRAIDWDQLAEDGDD